MKHVSLTPQEDALWAFSLDEMGRYDVPALIRYITEYTHHDRLGYIGFVRGAHSPGGSGGRECVCVCVGV